MVDLRSSGLEPVKGTGVVGTPRGSSGLKRGESLCLVSGRDCPLLAGTGRPSGRGYAAQWQAWLRAIALATVCWLGGQASSLGAEVERERAMLVAAGGVGSRLQHGGGAVPQAIATSRETVASQDMATPAVSARRASVMTVLTPLGSANQVAAPPASTAGRPSSAAGSRQGHSSGANMRPGKIGQYIEYHPATVVVTSPRREPTGGSSQGRRSESVVDGLGEVAGGEEFSPPAEKLAGTSPPEATFGYPQAMGGLQFASRRPQASDPGSGTAEGLPSPNGAQPGQPPTTTITDPLQIAGRPRALREIRAQIQPPTGLLPPPAQEVMGLRSWTVDAQELAMSRSDVETVITWEAPATCHRGLLFEEPNLERHGYSIGLFQPALSAAHFFGRVPILPYLAVSERANRVQYTLGRRRPGSDAPLVWNIPRPSPVGGVLEATTIVGMLYAFP